MASATPTSKFAFDRRFDAGAAEAAERRQRLHADELSAARTAALAEGYAAGHAAALTEIEAATVRAVEQVSDAVGAMYAELDTLRATLCEDAADLARQIGAALAGWQVETSPYQLIDQVAHDVFAAQALQPRLVVRAHDSLLDGLKARLDASAQALGFAGRLIFLAEPGLAPGDCTIEWADGGVECLVRNRAAAVQQAFDRYVAGLGKRTDALRPTSEG